MPRVDGAPLLVAATALALVGIALAVLAGRLSAWLFLRAAEKPDIRDERRAP